MEFEQFAFFLEDAETKLSKADIIYIYRSTCESNYRLKLACDDFIEAVAKYSLIPNKKVLDENRKKREEQMNKGGIIQSNDSPSLGIISE